MSNKANALDDLIAALPELYQPIYGYPPERYGNASRRSYDRLADITQVYKALEAQFRRPLRVLDLGCAQGFFTFSLAELGAIVHGVDYLDANIAVCSKLSAEHPNLSTSFQVARIEDVLQQLGPDQYDLVLGLSVVHHLVHEKGAQAVSRILGDLANKTAGSIFELALASEPIYWAEAQPQDSRQLLDGFAFVHELARHETHLSTIRRPLYFASNRYWCLNRQAGVFDFWQTGSHSLAQASHQGTRRYYFGRGLLVKQFRLDVGELFKPNLLEYQNEVAFLSAPPPQFSSPKLVLYGQNCSEVWLVRTRLPGELLIDVMRAKTGYDAPQVLREVLSQLEALEVAGLYHNDVRAWNVLIDDEGSATLIDYGAISKTAKDCVWPHDIFLAFLIFVHELATGNVDSPVPSRAPRISPFRLPEPYRKWMMAFWSRPVSEWSFKLLRELFMRMDTLPDTPPGSDAPGYRWMQAVEEVVELQIASIRHLEQKQQRIESDNQIAVSRLGDARSYAQWLQNEWDAAKQRVEELSQNAGRLERDLELERQQSAQLRVELRAALERASQLESQSNRLQREWDLANNHVAELNQQVRKLEDDLESERRQAWQLDDELRLTRDHESQLQFRAETLQTECDAAKAKIDELNQSSHHWRTVAGQLGAELQNVYASKSWRVTTPLRVVNRWRRLLLQAVSSSISSVVRKPLAILRRLGLWSASRPWFRRRVEQFLVKRPRLRARIRGFLLALPFADNSSPVVTGPTATDLAFQIRLKSRTWRVLRLFMTLPAMLLRTIGLWAAGRPWLRRSAERLFQRFPAVRERTRRFLRSTPTSISSRGQRFNIANATDSHAKIEGGVVKARDEKTVFYYWIDHTVSCSTNTGMQRVVRWLARAMIENGEEIVFVKWDGQGKRLILATQSDLQRLSLWSGPILPEDILTKYPADEVASMEPEPIGTRRGWLFVPEVTHITFHSEAPTLDAISCAKALGLKIAFIFYDAVPLKVEGYSESREAHAAYMQHIAVADALLPISQFAAEDLASFYVQRHGFTRETMPPILAVPLPGENYDVPRVRRATINPSSYRILCVGTIEPRKNHMGLIAAFNRLIDRHPELPLRLTIVGNLHPLIAPPFYKALSENPKIEYLQYVSDDHLWRLYGECTFTVFPSLEEGFGLPIIESLWHGKPCVCANFGAMGEIAAGGGCLAVNVRSPDVVTEAMERMLFDVEMRSRLTAEAESRPIKTWREYANELVNRVNGLTKPMRGAVTVYYWVDQTCRFPINTGVQRVVRSLAKALKEAGARLIPVKWNQSQACFYSPSLDELSYLSRWNGPQVEDWDTWIIPSVGDGNWLLVPEVTTLAANLDQVADCAEVYGLKKSVVFYDAIPFKMTDLYPSEFRDGHATYMRSLLRFDKIFSISAFSRKDLAEFLYRECDRLVNIDDKLLAIPLPGEFSESDRMNVYQEPNSTVIRILCVGRVEPRKNHLALLEAFQIVLRKTTRPVELTIAGGSLDTPELETRVSAYCTNHAAIRWLRSVGDSELGHLYSECHFSVYPSLEEGFGLPILESLWHARPCICRNSGAMAEVAEGGGCLTVDTTDVIALANAMLELVENDALRHQLGEQATQRSFKTWRQYAEEILHEMGRHQPPSSVQAELKPISKFLRSKTRDPCLSVCVTTYNRASWLAVSLENLFRWVRPWGDTIEVIVCDNASTDSTPDVVKPYLGERNFRYYRNRVNVGMLGNLKVTAHHSSGQYVWILGDDDLVREGTVERVLSVIDQHPAVGLIYLNYAYTRISDAAKVGNIDQFLLNAIPIVPPAPDKFALIKEISTLSENFFTAVYCLVFRRDHALRAYSQDTSGRPFSSLPTCIPTSFYICHNMFNNMGYWVGEPCVVVNMNVSWGRFAPLWILERIPELYDLAEKMGADPDAVDGWRRHTLEGAIYYLERIFSDDSEGNLAYFSIDRWIRRHKHLREFRLRLPQAMDIYARAFRSGVEGASENPERLLEMYGLVNA